MEVVLASWCLTLFTTTTQFNTKSQYLDEIMDIFYAEGWVGFTKIVLVILQRLEEKLMLMTHEEIIVSLSEIAKNNFNTVTLKQMTSPMTKMSTTSNYHFNFQPMGSMDLDRIPSSSFSKTFSFKSEIQDFCDVDQALFAYFRFEYY